MSTDHIRAIISGVLGLFWLIFGYFGLLWVAKRFFTGRYRAETAAAAVVVAFTIGVSWPRPEPSAGAVSQPPVGSAAAVAPPAGSSGADVGAVCASARLTTDTGRGYLDSTDVQSGKVVAPAEPDAQLRIDDIFIASGWAADPNLKGPPASVCVVIDGKILSGVRVLYGTNRPDVATAYQNGALASTGFTISVPAVRVPAGLHRIQAAAVASDGAAALLPGGVRISGPPAGRKS
jgi:hypothetical protein